MATTKLSDFFDEADGNLDPYELQNFRKVCRELGTQAKIAAHYGISPKTLFNWLTTVPALKEAYETASIKSKAQEYFYNEKGEPIQESLTLLRRMKEKGLTNAEIADILGVKRDALEGWYEEYPEIEDALKGGKQNAVAAVVAALFKSAIGFSHPETKFFAYQGSIIEKETEKQYAPNQRSIEYFLQNQDPASWKSIQHIDLKSDGESVIPKPQRPLAGMSAEDLQELMKAAMIVENARRAAGGEAS